MFSTGTVLGTATFAMVALTALSLISAVSLAALGDGHMVALALICDGLIFGVTVLLPREDGLLAEGAHRAVERGNRLLGYVLAGLSSGAVPAAVVAVNMAALGYYREHVASYPILSWLLSYGVATGAWTFRAQIAARRNRTLSSIQAYAAHFSYALLSISVLVFGCSADTGLLVATFPQILPFAVGFFLAMADRNALRDVQI